MPAVAAIAKISRPSSTLVRSAPSATTMRVADMDEVTALCELLFDEHSNVSRYYTMVVNKTGKETTAIPM